MPVICSALNKELPFSIHTGEWEWENSVGKKENVTFTQNTKDTKLSEKVANSSECISLILGVRYNLMKLIINIKCTIEVSFKYLLIFYLFIWLKQVLVAVDRMLDLHSGFFLVAAVESSFLIGDQTLSASLGVWSLSHCTPWEIPMNFNKYLSLFSH